jgi:hypothetical protein
MIGSFAPDVSLRYPTNIMRLLASATARDLLAFHTPLIGFHSSFGVPRAKEYQIFPPLIGSN